MSALLAAHPALLPAGLLVSGGVMRRAGFGPGYVLFLAAVVLGFAAGGDLETVADTLSTGTNTATTFLWVATAWAVAAAADLGRFGRARRAPRPGGSQGQGAARTGWPCSEAVGIRTPARVVETARPRGAPALGWISLAIATALPSGAPALAIAAQASGPGDLQTARAVLAVAGLLVLLVGGIALAGPGEGDGAPRARPPQWAALLGAAAGWRWGAPGTALGALAGLAAAWMITGAGVGRALRRLRGLPLADLALLVVGARVLAYTALDARVSLPPPSDPWAAMAVPMAPLALGLATGCPAVTLGLFLPLLPGDATLRLAAACGGLAGCLAAAGGGVRARGAAAALALLGSLPLAWRWFGGA